MDQNLIDMMRVLIPAQVAKELVSMQPIQLTVDDIDTACDWIEQSRINRGVDPLTEETLNS